MAQFVSLYCVTTHTYPDGHDGDCVAQSYPVVGEELDAATVNSVLPVAQGADFPGAE